MSVPSQRKTPTFAFPIIDIIQNEWLNIVKFYPNVLLDEFVIMPNHFHGIIGFNGIPVANVNQKKYQPLKDKKMLIFLETMETQAFSLRKICSINIILFGKNLFTIM